MCPPPLSPHVPQGILPPALVELVEDDEIGEVEHVDLLELRGRPVLGGHHVEGEVGEVDHLGVALADPGRLDHHEVEAGSLEHRDGVAHDAREGEVRLAGRQRAHEDPGHLDRVHAEAVGQERPAGATARRIDEEHPDAAIRELPAEAAKDLVDQAALARPPRPGEADHGRTRPASLGEAAADLGGGRGVAARGEFEGADQACDRQRPVDREPAELRLYVRRRAPDALSDDLSGHPLQAETSPVFGAEDARHAVGVKRLDLVRHDHAPATSVHPDVSRPRGFERVAEVAEVLDVPPLIGGHADRVGVLSHRGPHDVADRAVVAEVDDLGSARLQQAAHDVDRDVVAVEQRRGGHHAHRRSGVGGELDGGLARHAGPLG